MFGGSNIYSPGIWKTRVWVFPKTGFFSTKMDGENNGSKPYEQMDDLGETPIFGQIIATENTGPDFPRKGSILEGKWHPLIQGHLGWWNIMIY